MLGARGTVRYIALELFCRNFEGVTHKLDVYNYGMMVLEMIGEERILMLALIVLVKYIFHIGFTNVLN